MNFLKSVLSTSGGFPGYTIQDKIDVPANCIFSLNNATVRETGAPCSVFTFELARAPTLAPLAKNYYSKLRSLKHPGVVKFLDGLETESYIYIATERVAPLLYTLAKVSDKDLICWGLYSVATTIAFLNAEATSVHGNIRTSSIFTTESGEWKLAGFEALTSMKDDDPFCLRYGSIVPDIYLITPPELQDKGFSELRNLNFTTLDSWQFACFVWTCFNGVFSSANSLTSQGKIPNSMLAQYRRLLSPQAMSRLPVSNFVTFGRRPNGFFRNDLIEISDAIPSLPLKSKAEVESFLSENMKVIASLPSGFTKSKVLPELVKSLEFGGGGATAFTAIMTITKDLAPSDIEQLVTPFLLRLWTSKDRSVYLVLLENLKEYVEYLTPKQINDKLFPALGTAFKDPAPIMRETAIRQVMILTPHLSDRNINGDLLKYLAKTANDQQPGIRTNTTICLGKISSSMGVNNKRKVLTAAFSRSLKDPFIHARMAALQAISATFEVYDKEDLATRLMPSVVMLLIDSERSVRVQAKKTLSTLLSRIEELTQNMPEILHTTNANGKNEPTTASAEATASGAVETAGVWAGWAISTLSRNIDSSSPVPTANASTASLPLSRTTTPANDYNSGLALASAQEIREKPKTVRSGSGLKLAAKPKKIDVSAIYAEDFGTGGDAWGTDDWDEPNSIDKSPKSDKSTRTITLAKPLAKSTSKVVKTMKQAPVKSAPKAEEIDDGEDWDNDAW